VGVSFLIICVEFDRSAAVVKWAVLERVLWRRATSQSCLESYQGRPPDEEIVSPVYQDERLLR